MAAISIGEIEATLRLRDELTSQLAYAQQQLKASGENLKRIGSQARELGTSLSIGVTLPLVAAATAALKFSSDFETAMTKVGNLTSLGTKNLKGLSKEVIALSRSVGVGPKELAEGLLVVASTGLYAETSMRVLEQAAKATAVGLGDTKDVARAVTSAITAYGKEHLSAAEATNKLFVAVREGGAEADQFAGSLGRVIGIAAQVGVSFDEVLASMASFTRLGVDADEAATALRGTLATILKPTKEAREQLDSLGLSIEDLRKNVREKGLTVALRELVELTNGNEDALAAIIPNVRALSGVLGTAGVQGEAYADTLKNIKDGSQEMEEAFKVTAETVDFKWNQAITEAKIAAIELGVAMRGSFVKIFDAAKPLFSLVSQLIKAFSELPGPVQTAVLALAGIAAIAGPTLIFFGSLLKAIGEIKVLMGTIETARIVKGITDLGLAAQSSTVFVRGLQAGLLGLGIGIILAVVAKQFDQLNTDLKNAAENAKGTKKPIEGLNDGMRDMALATEKASIQGNLLNDTMEAFIKPLGGAAKAAGDGGKAVKTLSQELAAARSIMANFNSAQKANIEAGLKLGYTVEQVAEKLKLNQQAVQLYKDALDEAARSSDKMVEILKKISAAQVPLTITQMEQIEVLHKLGQSVADIAEVMKVSEVAVGDFVDSFEPMKEIRAEVAGVASAIESIFHPVIVLDGLAHNATRTIDDFVEELDKLRRWQGRSIFEDWTDSLDNFKKRWQEFNGVVKETLPLLVQIRSQLSEWANTLTQLAQVSGDSFGGIVKDIAEVVVAWEAAARAADAFRQATKDASKAGQTLAIAQGVTAIAAATEGGGAKGIAGGALSGMQMGAAIGSIIPGIGTAIGAAVGAVAGAIVGVIRSFDKKKKDFQRMGAELGAQFSDEFIKKLKDTFKETGDHVTSLLLNLSEAFEEAGGVAAVGLDKAIAKTREMFVLLEMGTPYAKQIGAEFNQVFGQLLPEAISKTTGFAKKEFLELIALARRFGLESENVTKFLQGMSDMASEGLNKIAAGTLGIGVAGQDAIVKMQDELVNATDKAERLEAQIKDLNKKPKSEWTEKQRVQMKLWTEELVKTRREIDTLRTNISATEKSVADFAKGGQEAFDRFGRLAVVAFATGLASGKSFMTIIEEIGPGLDEAAKAQDQFGFAATGAFKDLVDIRRFIQDNKELAGVVDGVNQMLTGLQNSGMLTQDTFNDLSKISVDTFNDMQKKGLTANQALTLMQPTLQRLWELQEKFGFEVDEATQKLIDQGKEAGIVGEEHRSASDKMVIALEKVVGVLELIAVALGVTLPDAAADGAAGVNDELSKIKPPVIDFDIRIPPVPDFPTYGQDASGTSAMQFGGMMLPTGAVQRFEFGGMAGPDRIPALLAPGETVRTPQQETSLQRRLESGGGGSTTVKIYLKDTEIAEVFVGGVEKNGKVLRRLSKLVRQVKVERD